LFLQTSGDQKQQRGGYGVVHQKPFIVPDWITTVSFAFHRTTLEWETFCLENKNS